MHNRSLHIGYSFFGSLADEKIRNGQRVSTPDGNASYSWAIIRQLQRMGHRVYRLQEDRDAVRGSHPTPDWFRTLQQSERWAAYLETIPSSRETPPLDLVLHEWRMPVSGRNTPEDRALLLYERDLERQDELLAAYGRHNPHTRLVAFDLDYQMTKRDDELFDTVLELGTSRGMANQVHIPTTRAALFEYPIVSARPIVSYIGNRYDRDESVDRYLEPLANHVDVHCYGNWLERQRDSKQRWPQIFFHGRCQFADFPSILQETAIVPLILKDDYYTFSFMTARIIEVATFGAVPAVPRQFVGAEQWVPEELIFDTPKDLLLLVAKSMDYEWRKRMVTAVRNILVDRCDSETFAKRLLLA